MILETQTNGVLLGMFQVQAFGIGIVDDIGAQQDARRIGVSLRRKSGLKTYILVLYQVHGPEIIRPGKICK